MQHPGLGQFCHRSLRHVQSPAGNCGPDRPAPALLQAVVFDEYNHQGIAGEIRSPQAVKKEVQATERFRRTCFHLFSLLHALCVQHLRTDWDLQNLRPHLPSDPAPPVVLSFPAVLTAAM